MTFETAKYRSWRFPKGVLFFGYNNCFEHGNVAAARERLASARLDEGQQAAAELMATTSHRVIGIQGRTGNGKSHMLKTAKELIESQGFKVRALASYGSQAKALRELGVASNTLASLLKAKDKNIDSKTVLVLDEAGVVPTRLMEQTLKLAEKAGARVVLVGDTTQTKAIEAGRPFDQLQVSGMATAHMSTLRRQLDRDLKCAVALAAKGDTKSSLERIRAVTEIADHAKRRAAIAAAFVSLDPGERDRTLIVSGINAARREINARVHASVAVQKFALSRGPVVSELLNQSHTSQLMILVSRTGSSQTRLPR